MGANKDLEIERGGLQKIMSMNFYLCDLEHTKRWEPKLEYLSKWVLYRSHTKSGNRDSYPIQGGLTTRHGYLGQHEDRIHRAGSLDNLPELLTLQFVHCSHRPGYNLPCGDNPQLYAGKSVQAGDLYGWVPSAK